MPDLPTCQCVRGLPPYDRLTAIYQAAADLSGDSSLPDVLCVAGVPPFSRFAYIYAAFRVISEDTSLPSMECVEGESPADQVSRIYQAAAFYADSASLLSYPCVRGLPLWQQWVEIYRALYVAAGSPAELTSALCVNPTLDILSEVFCGITYLIENANPIVLSATILGDASSVLITFNQSVNGFTGFTFTVNGTPATYTYQDFTGTNQLQLQLEDTTIVDGDVILMSYVPGDVVSVATGNPLEAFSNFPVTNPFTVYTYVQPDGFAYFQPDGVSLYLQP